MKKSMLIAVAVMAGSVAFAQQKKEKQPPPPPPPPPVVDVRNIPPPPPPPEAPPHPRKDVDAFLKRNPAVKGISWSDENIYIRLKSGKEEVYDLKSDEDMQKLKDKYGDLPVPPPPPPPPKVMKEKTVI